MPSYLGSHQRGTSDSRFINDEDNYRLIIPIPSEAPSELSETPRPSEVPTRAPSASQAVEKTKTLVTGGAGIIASAVVKELLKTEHAVKVIVPTKENRNFPVLDTPPPSEGTVESPIPSERPPILSQQTLSRTSSRSAKMKPLGRPRALRGLQGSDDDNGIQGIDTSYMGDFEGAETNLEGVEGYVGKMTDEEFVSLLEDVKCIHHNSSPFLLGDPSKIRNPDKKILRPAVQNTLRVLRCAILAKVPTVVLTTSIEVVWDEQSKELSKSEVKKKMKANPFHFAKLIAEKEAKAFLESIPKHEFRPRVVFIKAGGVIGPTDSPILSPTARLMHQTICNKFVALKIGVSVVDIRDVAKAHVLAQDNPAAEGNYPVVAQSVFLSDAVSTIAEEYGRIYRFPYVLSGPLPAPMISLASGLLSAKRKDVKSTAGIKVTYDTTRTRNELGLTFRPVRESVLEMFENWIKWGYIRRTIHTMSVFDTASSNDNAQNDGAQDAIPRLYDNAGKVYPEFPNITGYQSSQPI